MQFGLSGTGRKYQLPSDDGLKRCYDLGNQRLILPILGTIFGLGTGLLYASYPMIRWIFGMPVAHFCETRNRPLSMTIYAVFEFIFVICGSIISLATMFWIVFVVK